MNVWTYRIVCGLAGLLIAGGAVSRTWGMELSDAARRQLATATDYVGELDQGAWYPLLEAALQSPAPHRAVTAPDWEAIARDPAGVRGAWVMIEGRFAGRARRYALARPGPWGAAVTEWVILVTEPDRQGGDGMVPADPEQVAVVYLVDPAGDQWSDLRPGQRVRVPARFYKIWSDRDLYDRPTDYLCFVAGASQVVRIDSSGPSAGHRALPRGVWWGVGVGAVLLVLVVGWGRHSQRRRERPRRGRLADPHRGDAVKTAATLPEDPAAALAELARRARAKTPDSH